MRPTFVHLIVGLGLGTALAVSLALPGRLVIAGKQPQNGLTLPRSAARVVVEAALLDRPAARPHVEPRPALAARSSLAPRARALPVSYAPRPRPRQQLARAGRPAPAAQQTLETLAVAPAPKADTDNEQAEEDEKVEKVAREEGQGRAKERQEGRSRQWRGARRRTRTRARQGPRRLGCRRAAPSPPIRAPDGPCRRRLDGVRRLAPNPTEAPQAHPRRGEKARPAPG